MLEPNRAELHNARSMIELYDLEMFPSSRDRGQSRLSFKGVAMKLSWLFSLIVVLGACCCSASAT